MKSASSKAERTKKTSTPYVLGGMAGTLFVLICSIFSLSVLDHYLLGNESLASVISAVLVDLTNVDRSSNNIGGLVVNPVLTAAAQAKADDMASKGYFAHTSPDGRDSWYWFKQAGYTFSYAGENLAVDFSDSVDVERAWMNSPTHRANLLDGHFTQIGIAVAQGTYQGHPTTFVVQMFGTPAEMSAPARVTVIASPREASVPALAVTNAPKVPVIKKISSPAPPSIAAAPMAQERVLGAEAGPPTASWWEYLLSSPKTNLRYLYYAIAAAVLVLLAFVTELEFHKRHRHHLVAAATLLVLMTVLALVANVVFFTQPVIAALQP